MDSEFKLGDKVRSIVGGPEMVITMTATLQPGVLSWCCCYWDEESRMFKAHYFPPAALKDVDEEDNGV